jgi:phage terminase large subunit-like protein
MTRDDYRRSLKGRRCYVGMDLSSTKDLTALVAVFPDGDGGYDVLAQFFVPKDHIKERSDTDRAPYRECVQLKVLTATPGNQVDYEYVRQTLKDWAAEFQIREIAFDPWNATDLVQRLQEQDGFICVPMRQGFNSLSAPSKSLERLVLSKAIHHDGNVLLRWCIGNVVVELDAAGNIKPSKAKSTERIDGCVALIMGIDRAEHNAGAKTPTYTFAVIGGR